MIIEIECIDFSSEIPSARDQVEFVKELFGEAIVDLARLLSEMPECTFHERRLINTQKDRLLKYLRYDQKSKKILPVRKNS